MDIKNAALIGLGAMGVFFAPRMEEHLGRENFCVIAEGERKERLQTKGVTVNGVNYHFPICTPEDGTPTDLIIMATKDLGLAQAIKDIEKFVGPDTQILCVMNGVNSEEQVAAAYGWEHVLYSYMRMSVVMKDGKADFDPYWGKIYFGEKINETLSGRVEAVKEEISKLGVSSEVTDKIIEFIQIKGSTDEILQKLEDLNISNEKYLKGVEELKEVVKYIRLFKMPEENFAIDLTIARGLDYYTGTVYETFLNDYRELGSVCSGGRYENLAENYTDKKLPGVGVSIGLTRLFYKLNELNIIKADKKSISDILIIPMTENMSVPLELGTELRKLKVNTEIYLNNKKIKAKMKYADKLEIPYVVVIGDNEIETSKVKVKEMATGKETECELDAKEILNVIRRK